MSPREEALRRVRRLSSLESPSADLRDSAHLLAAYDEAVSALAKVTAQRDEARHSSSHWLRRAHALGDELDAVTAQRDAAMQRAADENAALFARNGDVARVGKHLDELAALADSASRAYAKSRGRVIPEMERLGGWLDKHFAEQPQAEPAEGGA